MSTAPDRHAVVSDDEEEKKGGSPISQENEECAASSSSEETVCNACGFEASYVPEGMLVCQRCQSVKYCSLHCLQWDWKSGGHDRECVDRRVYEPEVSESQDDGSDNKSINIGHVFGIPELQQQRTLGELNEIKQKPAVKEKQLLWEERMRTLGGSNNLSSASSSTSHKSSTTTPQSSWATLGSFLEGQRQSPVPSGGYQYAKGKAALDMPPPYSAAPSALSSLLSGSYGGGAEAKKSPPVAAPPLLPQNPFIPPTKERQNPFDTATPVRKKPQPPPEEIPQTADDDDMDEDLLQFGEDVEELENKAATDVVEEELIVEDDEYIEEIVEDEEMGQVDDDDESSHDDPMLDSYDDDDMLKSIQEEEYSNSEEPDMQGSWRARSPFNPAEQMTSSSSHASRKSTTNSASRNSLLGNDTNEERDGDVDLMQIESANRKNSRSESNPESTKVKVETVQDDDEIEEYQPSSSAQSSIRQQPTRSSSQSSEARSSQSSSSSRNGSLPAHLQQVNPLDPNHIRNMMRAYSDEYNDRTGRNGGGSGDGNSEYSGESDDSGSLMAEAATIDTTRTDDTDLLAALPSYHSRRTGSGSVVGTVSSLHTTGSSSIAGQSRSMLTGASMECSSHTDLSDEVSYLSGMPTVATATTSIQSLPFVTEAEEEGYNTNTDTEKEHSPPPTPGAIPPAASPGMTPPNMLRDFRQVYETSHHSRDGLRDFQRAYEANSSDHSSSSKAEEDKEKPPPSLLDTTLSADKQPKPVLHQVQNACGHQQHQQSHRPTPGSSHTRRGGKRQKHPHSPKQDCNGGSLAPAEAAALAASAGTAANSSSNSAASSAVADDNSELSSSVVSDISTDKVRRSLNKALRDYEKLYGKEAAEKAVRQLTLGLDNGTNHSSSTYNTQPTENRSPKNSVSSLMQHTPRNGHTAYPASSMLPASLPSGEKASPGELPPPNVLPVMTAESVLASVLQQSPEIVASAAARQQQTQTVAHAAATADNESPTSQGVMESSATASPAPSAVHAGSIPGNTPLRASTPAALPADGNGSRIQNSPRYMAYRTQLRNNPTTSPKRAHGSDSGAAGPNSGTTGLLSPGATQQEKQQPVLQALGQGSQPASSPAKPTATPGSPAGPNSRPRGYIAYRSGLSSSTPAPNGTSRVGTPHAASRPRAAESSDTPSPQSLPSSSPTSALADSKSRSNQNIQSDPNLPGSPTKGEELRSPVADPPSAPTSNHTAPAPAPRSYQIYRTSLGSPTAPTSATHTPSATANSLTPPPALTRVATTNSSASSSSITSAPSSASTARSYQAYRASLAQSKHKGITGGGRAAAPLCSTSGESAVAQTRSKCLPSSHFQTRAPAQTSISQPAASGQQQVAATAVLDSTSTTRQESPGRPGASSPPATARYNSYRSGLASNVSPPKSRQPHSNEPKDSHVSNPTATAEQGVASPRATASPAASTGKDVREKGEPRLQDVDLADASPPEGSLGDAAAAQTPTRASSASPDSRSSSPRNTTRRARHRQRHQRAESPARSHYSSGYSTDDSDDLVPRYLRYRARQRDDKSESPVRGKRAREEETPSPSVGRTAARQRGAEAAKIIVTADSGGKNDQGVGSAAASVPPSVASTSRSDSPPRYLAYRSQLSNGVKKLLCAGKASTSSGESDAQLKRQTVTAPTLSEDRNRAASTPHYLQYRTQLMTGGSVSSHSTDALDKRIRAAATPSPLSMASSAIPHTHSSVSQYKRATAATSPISTSSSEGTPTSCAKCGTDLATARAKHELQAHSIASSDSGSDAPPRYLQYRTSLEAKSSGSVSSGSHLTDKSRSAVTAAAIAGTTLALNNGRSTGPVDLDDDDAVEQQLQSYLSKSTSGRRNVAEPAPGEGQSSGVQNMIKYFENKATEQQEQQEQAKQPITQADEGDIETGNKRQPTESVSFQPNDSLKQGSKDSYDAKEAKRDRRKRMCLYAIILAVLIAIPLLLGLGLGLGMQKRSEAGIGGETTNAPISVPPTTVDSVTTLPPATTATPSTANSPVIAPVASSVTLAPTSRLSSLTYTPTLVPTVPLASPPPTDTTSPTFESSSTRALMLLLSGVSSDGGINLRTPGTPQYQAFSWLASTPSLDQLNQDRQIQRYALATFYFSTNGDDDWIDKDGWLHDNATSSYEDECDWFSRSSSPCHPSGLYRELSLGFNGVSGELPPEVGLLSQLTSLALSGGTETRIGGSIPSELEALSWLSFWSLRDNDVTGVLPPATLGALSELTFLDVSGNELAGSLPEELGSLAYLRELDVSRNKFNGTLPSQALGGLQRLRRLTLSSNAFSGALDDTTQDGSGLSLLPELRFLNVEQNQFTSLPNSIGLLTQLEVLTAFDNSFRGPVFNVMAGLTQLRVLDVHHNQFEGAIPGEIGFLQQLRYLDLSQNLFRGTIPVQVGELTNLIDLILSQNELDGGLPTELSYLDRLGQLRIESNNLRGTVPSEICNVFDTTLPQFWLDCAGRDAKMQCPDGDASTCCTYCCRPPSGPRQTPTCECMHEGTDLDFLC